MEDFDIAIIGGGINGCGIARDAAGRGLRVLLCEQNDLASATSSASTKLIHGGLRYLEHFKFRLVKESLKEREKLLAIAPHIVSPMQFVLPHQEDLRAKWIIRIGLFLYDNLEPRAILKKSKFLDLKKHPAGATLKNNYENGFEYSDCWVDDSRLVILNAQDAKINGAKILTRTTCLNAQPKNGLWNIALKDEPTQKLINIRSKILINATGPWLPEFVSKIPELEKPTLVRLVRGSHIIVPRQFEHDFSYIFQNNDKRIVFAIPYQQKFTLIGTTDVEHLDGPNNISISQDEISYLCRAVNLYLKKQIKPNDIIHSYSGVRSLFDDGAKKAQKTTRDYSLQLTLCHKAPLLNIFGGKITTYRKLAEACLDKLQPFLKTKKLPWTSNIPLPGGEFHPREKNMLIEEFQKKNSWLNSRDLNRLFNSYGTLINSLLKNVRCYEDMGIHFGEGLYEIEVNYLLRHEWAMTVEDILWRRTKIGLTLSAQGKKKLQDWLDRSLVRPNLI